MPAFNCVLLCYDGTREGQHALANGARLARDLRAQVHVLSVVNNFAWTQGADITSAMPASIVSDSVRSVLTEGLEKLAAQGIHATGHLAVGDPLDQIPFFARDLNVDLIIVGHHRTSRLARWWAGRTDGLLLDRVSCSVLVTMGPEADSNTKTDSKTASPVEHS